MAYGYRGPAQTMRVLYHSDHWQTLVSTAWITVSVDNGIAFMARGREWTQ